MNAFLFLALRAAHVLLAATWIGSTIFAALLLVPAAEAAGPAGGQVMARINRRGLTPYMAALATMTLLTGLYLFWHFTGFDAEVSASHAGIAFGVGGISGILAGVVGGSVVGRSVVRLEKLMGQAAGMTDGPAKSTLLQTASGLHRRMKVGSRVVIVLQLIALILMAVGHYV